eukprot:2823204-Amphidinium_carterae.1
MMTTFHDNIVLRLPGGRFALHRRARDITATHLRYLLKASSRCTRHVNSMSGRRAAFSRAPDKDMCDDFCTKLGPVQAKGIQLSQPDHFCEHLMNILGTEIQQMTPSDLTTHFSLGDGNCGWRSAIAPRFLLELPCHRLGVPSRRSVFRLQFSYAIYQNIEKLSSVCVCMELGPTLLLTSALPPTLDAQFMSNGMTYAGVSDRWPRACSQKGSHVPTIYLEIQGTHCSPAVRAPTSTVVSTPTQNTDAPDFMVGMQRPKRRRTRRIALHHGADQRILFLPADWSRPTIESEIARALGMQQHWAVWSWRRSSLTYEIRSDRPRIPSEILKNLQQVVRPLPAGTKRTTLGADQ